MFVPAHAVGEEIGSCPGDAPTWPHVEDVVADRVHACRPLTSDETVRPPIVFLSELWRHATRSGGRHVKESGDRRSPCLLGQGQLAVVLVDFVANSCRNGNWTTNQDIDRRNH